MLATLIIWQAVAVFVVYTTLAGVFIFLISAICLKSLPNIKSLLSLSENETVIPKLLAKSSLGALEPCPP